MPTRHRAWFVDPELAGGGAVMDHTVHLADILRWYLGSEVVEVYAQTNRIFHADEVEVETGGLLMLTFANGVFASIDCSWSKPDYYPTWGGLTFEMVTRARGRAGGCLQAKPDRLQPGAATRPPGRTGGRTPTRPCWRSLSRPSARTARRRVSGLDGYRALEVALAAYASAEERPAGAPRARLNAPAAPITAGKTPASPPPDCGRSRRPTGHPPALRSRSARRARPRE